MSFELEEWNRLRFKQMDVEMNKNRVHELRQAAQAIPAMEALTGQKDWDLYLSLIEGLIVEATEELVVLEQKDLDDPSMENHVLVASKARRLVVKTRIATLEEVRDIPKTLMQEGREAKNLLGRLGPDAAA